MVDKLNSGRGRPRSFDLEAALVVGQQLFHARGYDAVGLAALTDALRIKPASFYSAFGSKAEFFERILNRYALSELSLDEILLPGRTPLEALTDLLEQAAHTYAVNPQRLGCLVLEAARSKTGSESVCLARKVAERRRARIRTFVAASKPDVADEVTDYIGSTMSGLSASACEGMDKDRLGAIAHAAVAGLRFVLDKGRARDML